MTGGPSVALVVASAAAIVFLLMGVSVGTWMRRGAEEIEELRLQLDALKVIASSSSFSGEEKRRGLQQNLESCGCADSFTYASDFGVVGDSSTDDTAALQAAIDSAASNTAGGGSVVLPRGVFYTTSSLVIPGGVTLKGQGYGSSPLSIKFDAGSSVIAYCGTDYAVKVKGHAASLQDLAVYDWRYPIGTYCDTVKAAGGVLVEGDGELVESVTMSNILIYWFMGGTSLTLSAKNAGGVAFGNYQNIRIRHAHTGLLLTADATSFVK